MRVQDLDKSLVLLTSAADVKRVNRSIGAQCDQCVAVYVETGNSGRYSRVYGVGNTQPSAKDELHPHKESAGVIL